MVAEVTEWSRVRIPSGPVYDTNKMAKFDVTKHLLVPKHSIISEKEKKELFEKYSLVLENLPRILKTDPAIIELNVKEDDIIKVTRASPTAGTTAFYRRVVNG